MLQDVTKLRRSIKIWMFNMAITKPMAIKNSKIITAQISYTSSIQLCLMGDNSLKFPIISSMLMDFITFCSPP